MNDNKLTKEYLLGKFPDADWRKKYLEIADLKSFLAGCVLSEGYMLPDSFNSVIHLSEAGKILRDRLVRKFDVNAKTARVRAFLNWSHEDLFVDIERIDVADLVEVVHDQILSRKILIPNRFGRELYDIAAEEFEDEIPFLSHSETLRLLKGASIGWSQLGRFMTGPFGLLESQELRWLGPELGIPLYHCAKLTCNRIHYTRLSTDVNAEINRSMDAAMQILDPRASGLQAWVEFEDELRRPHDDRYSDSATSGLPVLLAEGLDDEELRLVLAELIEVEGEGLRKRLPSSAGRCQNPDEFAARLDRFQCLQLILLCKDREVISAIESLLENSRGNANDGRRIDIPHMEIRRPQVSRDLAVGIFELKPELGALGVRFKAGPGIPHLRLNRLVEHMFPRGGDGELEFDWQFRASSARARSEKQDEVLRLASPRDIVSRLVLSSYERVITAMDDLDIDEAKKADDTLLVDSILWKLGYAPDFGADENAAFWQAHAQMMAISQTAGASASVDRATIRGHAAEFFTELEHVLDDTLMFAVWLLLYDHLHSAAPFHYREQSDRAWAIEMLNDIAQKQDSENSKSHGYSQKNTLGALVAGPKILSRELSEMKSRRADYRREESSLPISEWGSDLRTYPFAHRSLFLDLSEQAQSRLCQLLARVTTRLSQEDVAGVRNSWLHYRREEADLEHLVNCLRATQEVVQTLEAAGLTRALYYPDNFVRDPGERTLVKLRSSRAREISVAGPSRLDLSALPKLSEPQYLITGAELAGSRDFVRIGLQPESRYSDFWANFPRRRKVGSGPVHATTAQEDGIRLEG